MTDMYHVKIYGEKLLNSSVWCGSTKDIKLLWVTLLAKADPDGRVQMSLPGLAKAAELTVDETLAALEYLKTPDPHSQTPDAAGRRVLDVDGGWQLVTYRQHRDYRTSKQIRDAERKARSREQLQLTTGSDKAGHVTDVTGTDVTCSPEVRGERGEVEVRTETTTKNLVGFPRKNGNDVVAIEKHLAVILDTVKNQTDVRIKKDDLRRAAAELVFVYWARKTNRRNNLRMDDKRETRLMVRLREADDNVNEMLYAVDGWFVDKTFQRLLMDDGRKLDGIENMFRDRAMVERLAGHMEGYRKLQSHHFADAFAEIAAQ